MRKEHYLPQRVRENADIIIDSMKKGFMRVVVIFGPTRTGKTTIAMQLGKYVSDAFGLPFDSQNIRNDPDALLEFINKKKYAVGIVDEAAFALTSNDWQDKSQQRLLKYMDTAAMYNQLLIFVVPIHSLSKLAEGIVLYDYSVGIETYLVGEYQRGGCSLYSHKKLAAKYHYRKMKKWQEAYKIRGYPNTRFSADISFIDYENYLKNKEIDINNMINNQKNNNLTVPRHIKVRIAGYLVKEKKLPHQETADIMRNKFKIQITKGTVAQYISEYLEEIKNENNEANR